jgi:hypothetical protein
MRYSAMHPPVRVDFVQPVPLGIFRESSGERRKEILLPYSKFTRARYGTDKIGMEEFKEKLSAMLRLCKESDTFLARSLRNIGKDYKSHNKVFYAYDELQLRVVDEMRNAAKRQQLKVAHQMECLNAVIQGNGLFQSDDSNPDNSNADNSVSNDSVPTDSAPDDSATELRPEPYSTNVLKIKHEPYFKEIRDIIRHDNLQYTLGDDWRDLRLMLYILDESDLFKLPFQRTSPTDHSVLIDTLMSQDMWEDNENNLQRSLRKYESVIKRFPGEHMIVGWEDSSVFVETFWAQVDMVKKKMARLVKDNVKDKLVMEKIPELDESHTAI